MPNTTCPLVPRRARHRHDRFITPLPVRPNPTTRRQPDQPLAWPYSPPTHSSEPQPPPTARRRWPFLLRLLCWCSAIGLGSVMLLGLLTLTGQTELAARIIVGTVLTVVFGTPLLCLAGLFALSIWARNRVRTGRTLQHTPTPAVPAPNPRPVHTPRRVGGTMINFADAARERRHPSRTEPRY